MSSKSERSQTAETAPDLRLFSGAESVDTEPSNGKTILKESSDDPSASLDLKTSQQEQLPLVSGQESGLANDAVTQAKTRNPNAAPATPAKSGVRGWITDDKAGYPLSASFVTMLVCVALLNLLCWSPLGATASNAIPAIFIAISIVYSFTVWSFSRNARKRLEIPQLDPIKAALPLPLICLVFSLRLDHSIYAMWADPSLPFPNLVAAYLDYMILIGSVASYAIYWTIRWPYLIWKQCDAIDSHARVLEKGKVGSTVPMMVSSVSSLLLLVPYIGILLSYFIFLWLTSRINKSEKTYAEMELSDRYALQQVLNKTKKAIKVRPDEVLIRYRAFSGLERWLKDRFSQKSWKKGALMLSFAAIFFGLNGPTYLLGTFIYLISLIPGSGVAAQSVAVQEANTSAVTFLLNMVFYPLLATMLFYVSKPTHLLLSPAGVRFIWRHSLLKINGRVISWKAVQEIRLQRKFGKTLPQDAALTLVGSNDSELFSAKLANIASLDDKAAVLEALDKWAPRTSRSAEVTELLRPPADHSYTELWLQAVTAPPKRERLKPLVAAALLHDGVYQVQEEIGSGGQGFAYLAKNLKTGEALVLKEYIMPVFVDMETRRRSLEQFEKEARTLQSLQNDRVVKLLDFFLEDHRAYLVLEHIEGENLKQLVEHSGPISESDCLKLASQMCEILRYLHGMAPPIVHRDFTPDNLILRPDGTLKLIDFNVAQQQETASFTGTVVGKHAYLPPEQFRGAATIRSDIYAMGCSLFYLLIGHDPEPISVSRPHTERAEISGGLNLLVAKCTALDETLRYQDVEELRQALDSTSESST